MAYIIGTYNRYDTWDRAHSIYKFKINDSWYAVKEVEMVWGLPMLEYQVDRDDAPETYHIYEELDEAMEFVNSIKQLNAR